MFNYNPQATVDRIDASIAQLQQMKQQLPQLSTPSINQTFQLAPNNISLIKYANSLEDVNREFVIGETPFFSKDMSVLWVKDSKGNIKTYELNEIIKKDEKDLKIELLQAQINELKKGIDINERNVTNDNATKDTTDSTRNDDTNGATAKED